MWSDDAAAHPTNVGTWVSIYENNKTMCTNNKDKRMHKQWHVTM